MEAYIVSLSFIVSQAGVLILANPLDRQSRKKVLFLSTSALVYRLLKMSSHLTECAHL